MNPVTGRWFNLQKIKSGKIQISTTFREDIEKENAIFKSKEPESMDSKTILESDMKVVPSNGDTEQPEQKIQTSEDFIGVSIYLTK